MNFSCLKKKVNITPWVPCKEGVLYESHGFCLSFKLDELGEYFSAFLNSPSNCWSAQCCTAG